MKREAMKDRHATLKTLIMAAHDNKSPTARQTLYEAAGYFMAGAARGILGRYATWGADDMPVSELQRVLDAALVSAEAPARVEQFFADTFGFELRPLSRNARSAILAGVEVARRDGRI